MSSPLQPQPSSRRGVAAAGVPRDGLSLAQGALLLVAVLYFARDLLVPLALAVLLSFVLAPVARAQRRLGIPRVAAVLVAVAGAVLVIAMLGLVMGRQLTQLANDLPLYQAEIGRKLESFRGAGGLIERAQSTLRELGEGIGRQGAPTRPAMPPSLATQDAVSPLPVTIHATDPAPLEVLRDVLSPLLAPLATIGIVIVLVIFVLLYREDLRDRIIRLVGARDLHRTVAAMDDAALRLSRFFLAQTALNAGFGAFIAAALFVIGVPQPLLWGIIAGLMRFVPFVGSFVAVAFPALLSLAVDPGWTMLAAVLLLFALTEPLMGQVLEPLVFGHSTGLSPIAVIAAATFWTWLWGPIGLLLAVPLTVCLVVLGRHVDRLEFLEVALGDRPPLDPPETFYQRALAGDADGLAEQAEAELRDKPLSIYYDEVALRGLALAQTDALRSSLDQARVTALRERVESLIEDLEDEEDAPPLTPLVEATAAEESDAAAPPDRPVPPPLAAPGSVLCVPGRGPFDGIAASMLAQLLGKHGFGAVVAPSLTELPEGPTPGLVFLCAIEGGSSAASLRYAIRRLRRRLPGSEVEAVVLCADGTARLPAAMREEEAPMVRSLAEALIAAFGRERMAASEARRRATEPTAG